MCDKSVALKILESTYYEIEKLFPVAEAYLYGSYARGDYTPYSDIDIMIVSPLSSEELHDYRWDIAHISSELSMDHDVTVSLTVRSASQIKPQQIPYYSNVLREGVKYQEGVVS